MRAKGKPVGFGLFGGAGPRDHTFSRCLTEVDGGIRFPVLVKPPSYCSPAGLVTQGHLRL
jgi:hypothetical protein